MKKVVLITGASAGMGKATAKLLAKKGYTVYAAARRAENMKDLIPMGIKTISMDITDDMSVTDGINRIISAEGTIDILINNAGMGVYGAVEDVSGEKAKAQFEVNVFGAARLIRLVLPFMRRAGWGKIINISSVGGKFATPLGGWYHASKFALEGLSDALRNEVKQFGIDVVVIEPGSVKSEWGAIACDNLLANSGTGAYGPLANAFAKGFKKTESGASEPAVIAILIEKALTEKKPKARYSGGHMAKAVLFFRALLPDSLFDKMIMGQIK